MNIKGRFIEDLIKKEGLSFVITQFERILKKRINEDISNYTWFHKQAHYKNIENIKLSLNELKGKQ